MGHDLKFGKEKEKKVNRLLEFDLGLHFHSLSLRWRGEKPMALDMKKRAREIDMLIPLASKRVEKCLEKCRE